MTLFFSTSILTSSGKIKSLSALQLKIVHSFGLLIPLFWICGTPLKTQPSGVFVKDALFEIVTTTAGAISIRNIKINEIMHNPVGPWLEANELYIDQSNLRDYLAKDLDTELVIYDVGLGAAANALATLSALKGSKRPVRLVSFEIDLDLLHFALEHSAELKYLMGYEAIIRTLLKEKYWEDENIKWELHHGDFLECIEKVEHKCHIVFYDPYSPKQNKAMWTTACFKKLRSKCQTSALFYNYSQATTIRAALLEAGFYVGYGQATGLKIHTTQAATQLKDLKNPLDQRWLERWKRSHTPFPIDCQNETQLKELILNHEQWTSS
jgi:tRNA U34 5-methylaminomethyl-2-thiouridine-forming methyltransferase MnmC